MEPNGSFTIGPYSEPEECVSFSIGPMLIFSVHLSLCFLSSLFPSGFTIKIFYAILISHRHATCPVHLIILDLMTLIVLGPQHPVLTYPQAMSIPYGEGSFVTCIQNDRHNFSFIYFNV
jgi:hypothetical protein